MRVHDGQVWRCCQPHDNKNNPILSRANLRRNGSHITPQTPKKENRSFSPRWRKIPTKRAKSGMRTDGKVYRSTMETANAYSPADYPQDGKCRDMEERTPRRGPVPRRGPFYHGRKRDNAGTSFVRRRWDCRAFAGALLTLVQIAPIKVNPWTAIGKAIGRAINGDVIEKEKTREPS